mmetsp:Transcript_33034/g.72758  ORF Transcript_33034/g.72758 Transcript_33034/m.72758 type:complete len:222 (-) Transcript_33034:281-946(-)
MAVLRSRSADEDGVAVDGLCDCVHVHAEICRQSDVDDLHAKVVRGLLERGVDSGRCDNIGLRDVGAQFAGPVAVRLYRHEDALSAARGESPRHVAVTVQHPGTHTEHLCLESPQRDVRSGVDRVRVHEHLPRICHQLLVRRIARASRLGEYLIGSTHRKGELLHRSTRGVRDGKALTLLSVLLRRVHLLQLLSNGFRRDAFARNGNDRFAFKVAATSVGAK